ncbi:hypothetical protein D3C71_1176310 [compost metagenome]
MRGRQVVHVADRSEQAVDVRVLPAVFSGSGNHGFDMLHPFAVATAFAQQAQHFGAARVAVGVEQVIEAGEFIAASPAFGDEGCRRAAGLRIEQQCMRACGRAAVAGARQRGQTGAHRGVQMRAGGGDHARCERRDVQFMVGTQHQRRAHHVRETRIAGTPGVGEQAVHRACVGLDADQQGGVLPQQVSRHFATYRRGGVERLPLLQRQQRNAGHGAFHRRQCAVQRQRLDALWPGRRCRCRERVLFLAFPQQARDVLQCGARLRCRNRRTTPVVRRVGADQRDAGFQHRQAAIQALCRTTGGAATGLLALCQPFDLGAQVHPAAGIGAGPRAQLPPADVGVQRGGADAEQGTGFAGGDQLWIGVIGHGAQ